MRSIIATLLSLLSLASTATEPPASPQAQASADLRSMILSLSPAEAGFTEETVGPVWGLVMETGMEGGYYTLVALADGSTSLYFSNGGGIIGGGEHASVRKASRELLATAKRHVESASPTSATPPPADGQTTFFFLTFNGIRSYTAPEVELGEQRDRLAPLFHSGHSVIMELRLAAP